MSGARITDAVKYYDQRGQTRFAVREVRTREPDGFRWRHAVGQLSARAGTLQGRPRARVEEPVREMVVDLPDDLLRREVVLDARRVNVDLDRGEILPSHRMGDLRRFAFLVGADMRVITRYVALPEDFFAPVDTAGCVVVARAMRNYHQRRAQQIMLDVSRQEVISREDYCRELLRGRAQHDADLARRWGALEERLLIGE